MQFAQHDLSNQSRRFPGWLASVLIFVSLLAMFYSGLVAHVRNATNPWVFNDDTRSHIPPLLRYTAAQTFKGDYLAEYHVAIMPVLFRSGYAFAATLGFDPRVLAKALPYPLFLATLIAIGLTAWRLGGPVAAWGSVALCLGTDIFLERITGGLARGFAFPLLALALASLVYGRPDWLAVITIAAAALYPPVSIVIGMTLLGMLMLPTEWPSGVEKWSNPRRLAVLAITALLSVSVVMPTFIRLRSYGPLLEQKDLATYPEIGRGGRYSIEDTITSPSLSAMSR
jgi:hypothetical protein